MNSRVGHRITVRKAIIKRVLTETYSSGPVLLEELRWQVLIQQYGPTFVEMTDAKKKSFARTVREHMPNLSSQEIPLNEAASGIVARAALFRMKSHKMIERFQYCFTPCIVFNVAFPDNDYQGQTFQRTTLGCYFKNCREPQAQHAKELELVIIPKSHRIKVLYQAPRLPDSQLDRLAEIPWLLYFLARNNPNVSSRWRQLGKLDPLAPIPFP